MDDQTITSADVVSIDAGSVQDSASPAPEGFDPQIPIQWAEETGEAIVVRAGFQGDKLVGLHVFARPGQVLDADDVAVADVVAKLHPVATAPASEPADSEGTDG